jgi:protein SCO1/2
MKSSLLVLSLFLSFAAMAQAQSQTQPRAYTFPDVTVVTQSGRNVHFYRDLVQGRTVVMNFIFTSCTTICPTMGLTFAQVQSLLGKRNVALVSVSIDPSNDTPSRLAAWSQKVGAKPGWTLVTGNKTDIDTLLKSMGLFSANPAEHAPVVLVGDDARRRWERIDGLAPAKTIVAVVDRVSAKEP